MNKCIAVLLLAGLASAQTQPKPAGEKPPEQIVYEFKNVDLNRAVAIANFVQELGHNRVLIHIDTTFKTAILRPLNGGSEDDMTKAEALLKRYDVPSPPPTPQPQLDFVAYLVRADTRGAAKAAAPPGQPIPPVLQEAVAEMKKTFPYTEYTLLDTIETEVHHGAHIENMLPGASNVPYFYEIDYGDTNLLPDRKTVYVNGFKFTVRIPVQSATNTQYQNAGITTNVQIREGQELVLGKVRTGILDPADIFLILTVKLR